MNIKFLKRENIDINKWNNCINSSHNELIYAYSWYLDIATKKNWNAIVANDYKFVMPVAVNKKFSFSYVFQPFFTQQSGVFSIHKINQETINLFIVELEKHYKYINTNFNFSNPVPKNRSFCKKKNYVLNLSRDYKTLRKSFSKNHIRNINKSYNNELTIKHNISIEKIINFKKQNLKNKLSENNLNVLHSLIKSCFDSKNLKVYAVYCKEDLIALSAFTISKNRYYNIISASNNKGFDKKASFFLFNEFIKNNAGKNIILDYEGSNIAGIARFFRGWGAENQAYYNFKQNKLPLPLKLFKK